MKTKLPTLVIIICYVFVFSACYDEPIIPVNESPAAETLAGDPNADKAEASARKSKMNSNALTQPVTGTIDGRNFTGNFTVTEFIENGGMLHALGNLSEVKITGKDHKYLEYILESQTYSQPVTIDNMVMAEETFQVAATCTVLNFNLNGTTLNVLGLAVVIDPINFAINADDSEVLGNLICTVLDTLNSVVDLVGLLNQILGLLSL